MLRKLMLYSYDCLQQTRQALFPYQCIVCRQATKRTLSLCMACEADLPILTQACPQCALILNDTSSRCGACLKTSPAFDKTYALFRYETPITHFIIQLKFYHQLHYARLFGELFIQRIAKEWYVNDKRPDLIIPIPLHINRLRKRGFNQALEIARPIARALHLPLDFKSTQRIKATFPQSGLPARLRQQNVQDAFTARQTYQGLTVAVVDDVMTTGHTLQSFCALLKQRGAKAVHVWCCARRG